MKYMLYHGCREVVKQVRCVQDRSPNQFQVGWNSSTVFIGVTNPVSPPPHLALLFVEISLLPCTATIKEIFWLINQTSKTYIILHPKNGGGIKWFELSNSISDFSGSTWIFSLSFVGGKKCRFFNRRFLRNVPSKGSQQGESWGNTSYISGRWRFEEESV